MIQLAQMEWMKLKKYRTFWIMLIIYVVLMIVWNFGFAKGAIKMNANGMNLLANSYTFPEVWSKVTYIAGWMILILCVLLITITSNEFQFKTHRQNVIDGLSRFDFFHSKLIVVFAISLFTVLVSVFTGLSLGFMYGGGNPLDNLMPLVYQFLYAINYLTFALLISLFVQKSGLSIALFFCYVIFIEGILGYALNNYFSPIGNFLPLNSSDELLPMPLGAILKSALDNGATSYSPIYYCISSLVYIAIYYFVAKRKMETSDL
jgi:ABC-type transport system involved in multi-copper enzyme maturation permease subunit